MPKYPTGVVTFLFTDIEGSTKLWEQHRKTMRRVMAHHDEIIESTVEENEGLIVRPRGEGDSRFAVFSQARGAVHTAAEIQQRLATEFADEPISVRVRIGMHTGSADLRMGDYYGSTVNRCARIRGIGHGGQTLLSKVTAELVLDDLPPNCDLIDMGKHRLKGLSREEHIYQLTIPDLRNKFPPLKSLNAFKHNLPLPPTTFIGRERELAEISRLLARESVRLVTLTGPGGTGKTRLSLEVGGELLDRFPEGVFFVDLAPINDPALVATTIARSMGVREGGGRPPIENLKDYLSDKQLLLLLDNFEQIVEAAPIVAELLTSAPEIKILVTSRIALQLRGEHRYSVSSMKIPLEELPPPVEQLREYEAVQLFEQQAKAVKHSFEITEDNIAAIIEICRRLDGLPLAIEIAAARIRMLPPQVIIKRLDQSLKLLVGGAKDLPARQRTLRSTIDWSFDLLEPGEQTLFARLGVFVGGFTLEATEGVCNPENDLDVFSGVETLLNNNLLRQVDSSFDEARFDMLQTMREYASEKLEEFGEMEAIRQAHALYFARKAEEMGEKIFGRHAVTWLKRIDEEHDNLRAVLSWGLETKDGIELAVRICAGLTWFWYRYGHFHEGREWSERALVAAEGTGDPSLRALALGAVALMAMWEGDLHIAAQLGEEAMQVHEQLKDDAILAVAKMSYGVILLNQGKDKEAYPQLVQAAELYDQEGQPWWKSTVLVHLGNVSLGLGEFEQAKRWLDEAMPVINEIGDQWQIAFGLNNYGEVARAQGNYAEAEEYYRKTEAYYQEADALSDQARLVHTFGYLAQHKGEYEKAQALFAESLKQFRELGNKRGMIECLAGLTSLASELGEHEWAAPLLSAAQAQLTSFGGAWWPADRVEFEATLARLQSALDEQSLELLWTGGRGMSLEQAIAYANANLR